MRQTGEEGQVINLDLSNVHFLPYMDVKGFVSCSPLTLTPCQLTSLYLPSKSADQSWPWDCPYMVYYGGVSCTNILKDQIIVSKPWKCMEISIHMYSKSGWWGNTIPMVWSITWVHIKWTSEYFQRGTKWVNLPYIWDQLQGNYKGHLDLLLLIIYRAIPEE